MVSPDHDLIPVSSGLASSAIAWRRALDRPELRVAVVEREGRPGGKHTWSVFDSDISTEDRAWLGSAIPRRWTGGYEICFPGLGRSTRARCWSSIPAASKHRESLRRVDELIRSHGWTVATAVDEEEGVLPIALDGDIDGFRADRAFYRLLDRMLFLAAEPKNCRRVMRCLHGLFEPLVRRFYAGRSAALDKARSLAGKPPVPIGRALKQLREAGLGQSE
jgi:hypothetical protein